LNEKKEYSHASPGSEIRRGWRPIEDYYYKLTVADELLRLPPKKQISGMTPEIWPTGGFNASGGFL